MSTTTFQSQDYRDFELERLIRFEILYSTLARFQKVKLGCGPTSGLQRGNGRVISTLLIQVSNGKRVSWDLVCAPGTLREETYSITHLQSLLPQTLKVVNMNCTTTPAQTHTSISFNITSELSTALSPKSLRLLIGTVPADSISQLVSVL